MNDVLPLEMELAQDAAEFAQEIQEQQPQVIVAADGLRNEIDDVFDIGVRPAPQNIEPEQEPNVNVKRILKGFIIDPNDWDWDYSAILDDVGEKVINTIEKSTSIHHKQLVISHFKNVIEDAINGDYCLIVVYRPVNGQYIYEYADTFYDARYLSDVHELNEDKPFININELNHRFGKRKLYTKIIK